MRMLGVWRLSCAFVGRGPIGASVLSGLLAFAILKAGQRSRGLVVPTDPDFEPRISSFAPAGYTPEVHDAFAEPTIPYRTFARLPSIHVVNINSLESADVRLYDVRGGLNADALGVIDRLLCDVGKPDDVRCSTVDRRTIQLLFRAAYHFGRREVVIISGYREPRKHGEGPHARGKAIDFQLTGVKLALLATHVRGYPRAGVGVYTHPRTQYVHIDSREHSCHWGDGSAPGVHGGEWSLGGEDQLVRLDAKYVPALDWPEGTLPPPQAPEPVVPQQDAPERADTSEP